MVRRRSFAAAFTATLVGAAYVAVSPSTLFAEPPTPAPAPPTAPPAPGTPAAPAAPAGPAYVNKELGLSMEGPVGWKVVVSTAQVSKWQPLAMFSDAVTGSIAQLSWRKASAMTLGKLRAEITKAYSEDKSFNVTSITDLPSNGRRPLSGVLVDAAQVLPGEPPPPGPAGSPLPLPPPPVTWHVQAAHFLGGDYEYRLYSSVKATLYSRLQPGIAAMVDGVTLKLSAAATAPRGEGVFRDETVGFACQYPGGYGVRLLDRELHLVEFAGGTPGPVLAVDRTKSMADVDADAKTVSDSYTGAEVGGEATTSQMEIAGHPAALVTAKARIGAKDQVFFVAIVGRSSDTFRLRCTADASQEADAKAAFDLFTKSFILSNPVAAPAATTEEKDKEGEPGK